MSVAKKSQVTCLQWLEDKISKLDLTGRDELYTHLISQEIPFWIQELKYGKKIIDTEVDSLISRRGFNKKEAVKVRKLVNLLNTNSRRIMESFESSKISLDSFLKKVQSELANYKYKKMFKEQWLDIMKREVSTK